MECTGCFCGSDEANRLVCTETNLEIGHSEKKENVSMSVLVDLVILEPVSSSCEQGNEPLGSIYLDKFATLKFLRRTLYHGPL